MVWIFEDPSGENVPEERLNNFREIRDEIEQKILDWVSTQRRSLGSSVLLASASVSARSGG